MSDEVKVAVLSSKPHPPPGMLPDFVLAGNPQNINESNEFGQVDLDIC